MYPVNIIILKDCNILIFIKLPKSLTSKNTFPTTIKQRNEFNNNSSNRYIKMLTTHQSIQSIKINLGNGNIPS